MQNEQRDGPGPAYRRLAGAIAGLLVDGRIPIRTRLPSERDLAVELQVSRTTVTSAYERLREAGYLVSRQGSGSWTTLPAAPAAGSGGLTPGLIPADLLDLAVAAPGPPSGGVLEAAMAAAAGRLPQELAEGRRLTPHGYQPAGLPELRARIAGRFTERGVATSAEQILVTNGAQGAIHLLAGRLLHPGDVLLVEQPTYPNGMEAFRRTGARLVPLPVTTAGWDLDLLEETLAAVRPRVAYLQPDFHNPTGALLDEAGRERLVAAARRSGTLLIIDETHAELALDGQRMPLPVAAFERDGRVITVGSFSKAVWGGLRIGWIRGAPRIVAELAAERASVDLGSPVLDHLVGAEIYGRLAEVLVERRLELAGARDVLIAAVSAHLPEWQANRPAGGLSLWTRLDGPYSTDLESAAVRHGLRVASGPRFAVDGTLERYLRLPYSLDAEQLEPAILRLAAARAGLETPRRAAASAPLIA